MAPTEAEQALAQPITKLQNFPTICIIFVSPLYLLFYTGISSTLLVLCVLDMLYPIDGQPGSFTAKKLASVLVRLVDEQGAPLPGVLVSVSGGENNYRTNEQTGPNRSLSFLGLSPGEYFVKPVLKDYEFEPRSKLITVKEGAEKLLELTAKRIAFSLYGSVTWLKGEPEAGVTMEAIGQGECTKYQEEATSGQVTSKSS